MPSYLIEEKTRRPILVYEAPLDEKTKEIRKQFDVDEKTGYPRHYNWRALSRLGSNYRPDEALVKLGGEYKPETSYQTYVTGLLATTGSIAVAQYYSSYYLKVPVYSKPQYAITSWALINAALYWYHKHGIERQGYKHGIYVDYIRKHPERFETIHRPKLREVLMEYHPSRG